MKGSVTLVIAIFFMLIFALLGITLLQMQAVDSQLNLRNFDSERALYIAESGANWAITYIKSNPDFRGTQEHILDYGEYSVLIRDPLDSEEGDIVIESTGYIPLKDNYRAKRTVKIVIVIGDLKNSVQIKNIFDWHLMHSGSRIDGEILAGHFDGDGDDTLDELGEDYDPPPSPILPPDGSGDNRAFITEGEYPQIDMNYFESNASEIWDLERESTIQSINGNRITVSDNIFTTPASQWNNCTIIRNLERTWPNDDSWQVITQRVNNRTIRVESVTDWQVGDRVRTGRRWYQSANFGGIIYNKGDVLIDIRTGNIFLHRTYIIADRGASGGNGDIAIRGTGSISTTPGIFGARYPSIATKYGNIDCPDTPSGGSETSKRLKHRFGGIVYTEFGDVFINYISGLAVMGVNVTLDGMVYLDNPRFFNQPSTLGFDFAPTTLLWKEE